MMGKRPTSQPSSRIADTSVVPPNSNSASISMCPCSLAVNTRVFAYGVLLAIAFGIFSGVYPAWRMARLHPVEALKGGPSR